MLAHLPTDIRLHQHSRKLEVDFEDGCVFVLPCEYLRVYSPSADVRGHSAEQAVLQTGKERVNIRDIEPIGNYAVKLIFDDGHETGLYTWDYLYELGQHQTEYWRRYLAALASAGVDRQVSAD